MKISSVFKAIDFVLVADYEVSGMDVKFRKVAK